MGGRTRWTGRGGVRYALVQESTEGMGLMGVERRRRDPTEGEAKGGGQQRYRYKSQVSFLHTTLSGVF